MAITAVGPTGTVDQAGFSRLLDLGDGMVGSTPGSSNLRVNRVVGQDRRVSIQPGDARVPGIRSNSNAVTTYDLPANAAGNPRLDWVVKRYNWGVSPATVVFGHVLGTAGATPQRPALTQTRACCGRCRSGWSASTPASARSPPTRSPTPATGTSTASRSCRPAGSPAAPARPAAVRGLHRGAVLLQRRRLDPGRARPLRRRADDAVRVGRVRRRHRRTRLRPRHRRPGRAPGRRPPHRRVVHSRLGGRADRDPSRRGEAIGDADVPGRHVSRGVLLQLSPSGPVLLRTVTLAGVSFATNSYVALAGTFRQ